MDYDYGDFGDFSSGYDSSYDYSYSVDGFDGITEAGILGGGIVAIVAGIVSLIAFLINLYLVYRFLVKMGYSGWLTLLNFVPLAPLVMWIYFAFAEWPVEKQAKMVSGGKYQAMPKSSETKATT